MFYLFAGLDLGWNPDPKGWAGDFVLLDVSLANLIDAIDPCKFEWAYITDGSMNIIRSFEVEDGKVKRVM